MGQKATSTRKVGRPHKLDRDCAVFLAYWWRTKCLDENGVEAARWIVSHWAENTPLGQAVGITDPAHVRAALNRVKKTWLMTDAQFLVNSGVRIQEAEFALIDPDHPNWLPFDSVPDDFEFDGCAIAAVEFVLHHRAKTMAWMPGMRVVRRGYAVRADSDGSIDTYQEVAQGRTPVALALAQLYGLYRLGRLERLHGLGGLPNIS